MDIVKTLLDVAATFITPDWGALVQLIPIGLALRVLLYLLWVVRTFAPAGPTRRAPARITPIPPPTVHMPGGSSAPIAIPLPCPIHSLIPQFDDASMPRRAAWPWR